MIVRAHEADELADLLHRASSILCNEFRCFGRLLITGHRQGLASEHNRGQGGRHGSVQGPYGSISFAFQLSFKAFSLSFSAEEE